MISNQIDSWDQLNLKLRRVMNLSPQRSIDAVQTKHIDWVRLILLIRYHLINYEKKKKNSVSNLLSWNMYRKKWNRLARSLTNFRTTSQKERTWSVDIELLSVFSYRKTVTRISAEPDTFNWARTNTKSLAVEFRIW